jgi:hypothetical protein
MREFEKWKKANIRGVHDPDYYMGLEEGWKAGLKWVYIHRLCSDEGWYIPPDIIINELEGQKTEIL